MKQNSKLKGKIKTQSKIQMKNEFIIWFGGDMLMPFILFFLMTLTELGQEMAESPYSYWHRKQ